MIRVLADLVRTVKDAMVWAALLAFGLSIWAIFVEMTLYVRLRQIRDLGLAVLLLAVGVQMVIIGQVVYDAPLILLDLRTWSYAGSLGIYSVGAAMFVADLSLDELQRRREIRDGTDDGTEASPSR